METDSPATPAWRQVIGVYEEVGGAYTLHWYRSEDGEPEVLNGISADELVEHILAPPQIKNLWWNRLDGQPLSEPPAAIQRKLLDRGRQFVSSSIPCPTCDDSGRANESPCPLCQAQ